MIQAMRTKYRCLARRGACREMRLRFRWWRPRAATASLLSACLLSACAPRGDGPAPLVSGEPAERGPVSVAVQRGQTLSGIAHTYHVPMRVLADANGITSPYRVQVGRTLIIPGASQPRAPVAPASVAALPPTGSQDAAASVPRTEPPVPSPPARPPVISAPLSSPLTSTTFAPAPSAVVGAPNTDTTAASLASPAAPAPAPQAVAPEPPASSNAAPAPSRSGSAFLWPVRGRVLAAYGSKTDGTHNDGINIGAPKGAAVQAADAGIVAYTGNELRGYGNLILVKHPNGWISAYAHCDLVLVKRGEKVVRGQVIARVGSTGNVGEPQLHFELRRGNHPVDPGEFLTPLPTADGKDARTG
jgi:murein DD-endopeptidase MepM/ murein hydrolase activator NlpD